MSKEANPTRPAAVAGAFYPWNPAELRTTVDRLHPAAAAGADELRRHGPRDGVVSYGAWALAEA